MASSDTLTYDDDPPHRAAVSELGGGAKENSVRYPPDPVKHPTAEDFNQFTQQLGALNRVMPLARLWVRFAAGVPSIDTVQAAGSTLVPGSFTVTDTGTGDTLISWKTGTGVGAPALPAAVGVTAHQTDNTEIDRIRAILTTSGSDPAAQVVTKLIAVATDCNFCLEIF
jgi:hypothetical protein